jgi:hypothetical protein
LLLVWLVALFCLRDASGASARFHGFPSRQKLVVIAVPNPPAEPIAKLPPPIAPGTDKNQLVAPHHDALGTVTIENHAAADSKTAVTAAPVREKNDVEVQAEARGARIKAERKRLNNNAVIWQQERAAGGSATAQRSLAMRYLTGDGVEKDEVKGMDLLRKGAAGGDSAAKKELAKREPAKKE